MVKFGILLIEKHIGDWKIIIKGKEFVVQLLSTLLKTAKTIV